MGTFVETFSTDAEKAVFTDYTDGYAITAVHTEATGANVSGAHGLIVTGTNGSQAFSSMAVDTAGTVSSEWMAALSTSSTDITTGWTSATVTDAATQTGISGTWTCAQDTTTDTVLTCSRLLKSWTTTPSATDMRFDADTTGGEFCSVKNDGSATTVACAAPTTWTGASTLVAAGAAVLAATMF